MSKKPVAFLVKWLEAHEPYAQEPLETVVPTQEAADKGYPGHQSCDGLVLESELNEALRIMRIIIDDRDVDISKAVDLCREYVNAE